MSDNYSYRDNLKIDNCRKENKGKKQRNYIKMKQRRLGAISFQGALEKNLIISVAPIIIFSSTVGVSDLQSEK